MVFSLKPTRWQHEEVLILLYLLCMLSGNLMGGVGGEFTMEKMSCCNWTMLNMDFSCLTGPVFKTIGGRLYLSRKLVSFNLIANDLRVCCNLTMAKSV